MGQSQPGSVAVSAGPIETPGPPGPARNHPADRGAATAPDSTTVSVSAEAGSVRVVAIPVPSSLKGRGASYQFIRQSEFRILGQLERTLDSHEALRPVILSVAVPSNAPAGPATVGVLRFHCDSQCAVVDVAVTLLVLPRAGLHMSATRPVIGARAGGRARAEVMVSNTGNAFEWVALTINAPNAWRARVLSPTPLREGIESGATVTIPMELAIPGNASAGDYGVLVHAISVAGATADIALNVHVSSGSFLTGSAPILSTSLAFVREPRSTNGTGSASDANGTGSAGGASGRAGDGGGGVVAAASADLSGQLLPNVWAEGQLTSVSRERLQYSGAVQRALGRQGLSSRDGFLHLRAPNWEAGLGGVGYEGDGIAGGRLWGVGATGGISGSRWKGNFLAAEPRLSGAQSREEGRYLIASAAHRLGPAWTGMTISSLSDERGGGRTSTALAADAMLPMTHGVLRVAVGERRVGDNAAQLAWLLNAEKRTDVWGASMRAAHMPGGSTAFARAENELVFDGYRHLGRRISIGAGVWTNDDSGRGAEDRFGSEGWSISPQISFGRIGSLLIDTRSSSYRSTSALSELWNRATDVTASWSTSLGQVQATLGALQGTVTRSTAFGVDLNVHTRAERKALFVSVAASTKVGVWQLDASQDRAEAGAGLPTRQSSLGIRGDRIPVVGGVAEGYVEMMTYYLSASRAWVSSQVLGLDIRLGNAYGVVIDAGRDQLRGVNENLGGRTPWLVTTRLRYSLALPVRARTSGRAIVFNDVNDDGVRNSGENGVAGIVVHVDSDTRTTDSKGRFEASGLQTERIEIDQGSLPPGLMVPSSPPVKRGAGAVELRVVPTTAVDVQLQLASTAGIDSGSVHLAQALVFLTDSLGRRWTGTPNPSGLLRLDALPPGSYLVSADLSRVGEVLTLPDSLPGVLVDGTERSLKVVLLLSPRRIRILSPPRAP